MLTDITTVVLFAGSACGLIVLMVQIAFDRSGSQIRDANAYQAGKGLRQRDYWRNRHNIRH